MVFEVFLVFVVFRLREVLVRAGHVGDGRAATAPRHQHKLRTQ